MRVDELETPVPIVDIDRLEANISRLQSYLDEHGIANRPHIKTHKIPAIAQMQMNAGAVGITCQKVSEAEVMADAGFTDANPADRASDGRWTLCMGDRRIRAGWDSRLYDPTGRDDIE